VWIWWIHLQSEHQPKHTLYSLLTLTIMDPATQADLKLSTPQSS
jgi:hypothetical protein